jgi:hypothetical protein
MSGKRVLSEHIEVEVYRRLRLHPEYIYLVPGASYVVNVLLKLKINIVFIHFASLCFLYDCKNSHHFICLVYFDNLLFLLF